MPTSDQKTIYLEMGQNDRFGPSDLKAWRKARKWPADHWQDTRPLIFINGCHTVEYTPESMVNFVDEFSSANASGVLGTEISVLQSFASEAAETFFRALNQPNTSVGHALHQMRLHFLSKGNLLGMAYTPYCSVDLQLGN